MKEIDTDIKYFNNKDDMIKYLLKYHNSHVWSEKLFDSKKYIVKKKKSIIDHSNCCHIGAEILSMSKRIMNEVMCLAEDNDIQIYYQDTDSMHIMNDKISELAEIFKKKYGRELIGKNLGQFHNDFEEHNGLKALYSEKSIILGKKAYLDIVVYKDDKKEYRQPHFRMKGCPKNVLLKHVDENYNGRVDKLYKDLFDGIEIEFDLLSCGVKFEFGNNHTIKTVDKFIRKISFDKDEGNEYNENEVIELFNQIKD